MRDVESKREEIRYEVERAKDMAVSLATEIEKSCERLTEELERIKEAASYIKDKPEERYHFPTSLQGMQRWNELPGQMVDLSTKLNAASTLRRVVGLLSSDDE